MSDPFIKLALDPLNTDRMLAFIPSSDGKSGHHCPIPMDLRGLVILYDILRARYEAASSAKPVKIGMDGALTEWQIKELIKRSPVTKVGKPTPKSRVEKPLSAKQLKMQQLIEEMGDLEIDL